MPYAEAMRCTLIAIRRQTCRESQEFNCVHRWRWLGTALSGDGVCRGTVAGMGSHKEESPSLCENAKAGNDFKSAVASEQQCFCMGSMRILV